MFQVVASSCRCCASWIREGFCGSGKCVIVVACGVNIVYVVRSLQSPPAGTAYQALTIRDWNEFIAGMWRAILNLSNRWSGEITNTPSAFPESVPDTWCKWQRVRSQPSTRGWTEWRLLDSFGIFESSWPERHYPRLKHCRNATASYQQSKYWCCLRPRITPYP